MIEKLNIYDLFDCIIAREDVDNLKPSGDAYLKALNVLNKNAEEALAIEDSKRGIEAALSAKLKIVKVNSKYCYCLRKYDCKVPFNAGSKELRPFIGVLFKINDCEYFAPLSSPK